MFIVKTVPGLEGFSTEQQDLYNISLRRKMGENHLPRAIKINESEAAD
jgi:hypothetical protein